MAWHGLDSKLENIVQLRSKVRKHEHAQEMTNPHRKSPGILSCGYQLRGHLVRLNVSLLEKTWHHLMPLVQATVQGISCTATKFCLEEFEDHLLLDVTLGIGLALHAFHQRVIVVRGNFDKFNAAESQDGNKDEKDDEEHKFLVTG